MEPTVLAKVKGRKQRMTPDEVKAQLFTKLREEGIFNEFRAFLRNELVKHLYLIEPENVRRKSDKENDLVPKFPLEATNWLISEHLRRNRYDFTLSVFDLECGSSKSKRAFSFVDIVSYLGVDLNSESGRAVLEPFRDQRDKHFLWKLLSMIAGSAQNDQGLYSKLDVRDHTEPSQYETERLEDKRRAYDDRYDERQLDGLLTESLKPRVRRWRKLGESDDEMDGGRHSNLDSRQFYEKEMRKCRREMEEWRKSLEEKYQDKLQLLEDRERDSTAALQRQKTWFEEEMYRQRQDMLLEISKLRQREEEWESKRRFQEKTLRLESERIVALKKDMQDREECLKKLEEDHERWALEHKERIAMAEQRKFEERLRNLNSRESELNARYSSLEAREKLFHEKEQHFRKTLEDAERLQTELGETKERISRLQTENDSLTKHANATAENVTLKEEIRRLRLMNQQRMEHEEMERARNAATVRDLMERLARPPPEVARLQNELEHLRMLHRKDLDRWTEQRGRLEDVLHRAENQHRTYIERLKIQSQQIVTLHKTIEDLQNGLLWKHPRKTTEKNPNPPVEFFSSKTLLDQELKATDSLHDTAIDLHGTYFDTSLNPSHLAPELELGASTSLVDSFGLQFPDSDFLESTTVFDSTRARIRALEEEAAMLEQNYRALKMRTGENVSRRGSKNAVGFRSEQTTDHREIDTGNDDRPAARRAPGAVTNYSTGFPSSTPNGTRKASTTYESSPMPLHSGVGPLVRDVSEWTNRPESMPDSEGFRMRKSPEHVQFVGRNRRSENQESNYVPEKLSRAKKFHVGEQKPLQESHPLDHTQRVSGQSASTLTGVNSESLLPPFETARPLGTSDKVPEKTADEPLVRSEVSGSAYESDTGLTNVQPAFPEITKPSDEKQTDETHESATVLDLDSAWKNMLQISTPLNLDDAWRMTSNDNNLDQLWNSRVANFEDSANAALDVNRSGDAGVLQTVDVVISPLTFADGDDQVTIGRGATSPVYQEPGRPNQDEDASDASGISGGRASPLGSQGGDFEW